MCVESCTNPFLPNSDCVCVCPVGTTGHNCEDSELNIFLEQEVIFPNAVVDCSSLTAPENGLVNVPTTIFNSTATYSCNDGYNLVGDTTRTCLASGNWSGDDPNCTGV